MNRINAGITKVIPVHNHSHFVFIVLPKQHVYYLTDVSILFATIFPTKESNKLFTTICYLQK